MNRVIKSKVYKDGSFFDGIIGVQGGSISSFGSCSGADSSSLCHTEGEVFQFNNFVVLPGFIDVHVHLREPGFSYKETVESGTLAAARGGYTHVCSMPNLKPVPDSFEGLEPQLKAIENSAKVNVYPYGTITEGQRGIKLSDFDGLLNRVIAFSDDGVGVQNEDLMRQAMLEAKKRKKMIVAHCEDNVLRAGGYIHDGEYARKHGHKGINSESEWKQIERDLKLVAETGCSYHVCHISAKESVELLRQAKRAGLDVSGETAPHYLVLDDSELRDEGRFKMNPPIRSAKDREALIEGILDGTLDMIATDHAPHSAEEKGKGLKDSLMGIVGLETAFPVLYTELVKGGIISFDKLIKLLHYNPMKRFGIGTEIEFGAEANFTVFDLDTPYIIDSNEFLSMGKSTPFEGKEVYGRCKMTIAKGDLVWKEI